MLSPPYIASRVRALMTERGVRLRYCNESGSRAWGLASTDSDYDVRFIYQHHREWYLQLSPSRDLIGPLMELDGELDLVGWDLRKVLLHVAKSNPGVLEWLHSPVTYYVEEDFLADLRKLARDYFQPHRVIAHYLGIARSAKLAGYDVADGTWNVKKYCYFIRPVLAANYVLDHGKMPPVAFTELLQVSEHADVRTPLADLISRKARHGEGHRERIDPLLIDYFESTYSHVSAQLTGVEKRSPDPAPITAFFRETIGY